MNTHNFRTCAICLENPDKQQIDFSCGHTLCFKCFPYLLYNKIISAGIQKDFFMQLNPQYQCIICQKGKTQFQFIKLDKLLQEKSQNQPNCEFCEKKISTKCCLDCNENYCDECLVSFHQQNKKFINHKILSFDEKKQMSVQQLQCTCSTRQTMEFFCQICKSSICKNCAKNYHDGHLQIPFKEILADFNRINLNKAKDHLTKFYEAFMKFETKFRKNFEIILEKEQKEFDQLVDEIISSLLKLKEKNKEKSVKEYKVLENQLSLIQKTLSFLKEELERNSTLHPNKLFHMTRFISQSDCENTFTLNNFDIFSTFGHRKLAVIIEILKKLHQQSDSHCLTFFEEGFIIANSKKIDNSDSIYKNFQSDPIELLNKKPILLEKGSCYLRYGKLNSTTSFILKDETCLAWPGSEDDNGNYPLHIYNLSNKKKEVILPGSKSYITSVSTYPKDSNYESKKWLYCTDRCGLFRVYDLEKYKQFREIIKIDTLVGSGILSAVVFDDQFKEINEKANEKENVYVLMAFLEVNLPFRIYRIKIDEGKGEIIREIKNTDRNYCYTINFFHDAFYSKTCIFFGFSHSFIGMFDLKSEIFTKKFQTVANVTSINFIFKNPNDKEKIKRFLLYGQLNNLIIIANIDTGSIIKQVALPNITFLYDICLWDMIKGYVIIPTSNKNSIKLMDLENLVVLKSKEMGDAVPLNILKVLIKDREWKECMVLFLDGGYFPIMFYE